MQTTLLTGYMMDILDHVLDQPCSQAFLMRKFRISSKQAALIMEMREKLNESKNYSPQKENHNQYGHHPKT